MGIEDKDKKKKDSSFNKEAYKHAISMVESSGGKYLDNPTSSASGKYHFLYNSIKDDPIMEGISKRQFINSPELQEKVMDKALSGHLSGYAYGNNYAERLKKDYGSDYSTSELTALVHFLGSGNARKFLKDPEGFKVDGKNLSPQKYLERFRGFLGDYERENKTEEPAPKKIINDSSADERLGSIKAKDNTAVRQPRMGKTQNTITSLVNMLEAGGDLPSKENNSSINDLVTLFEGGGTHEQNPNGGIPQGTGSNGKPNLVEEGETKWNDYIFSNSIGLDGSYNVGGVDTNVFEDGGEVDPTDKNKNKNENSTESKENASTDPIGPQITEASKYPLKFTKTQSKFHDKGKDLYVQDIRENYMGSPIPFQSAVSEGEVDFSRAVRDEGAQAFLDRYNDPWTREKMKEQAGITDYDIDNMILRGLEAQKQVGGNVSGSKASYDHENHVVKMGENYKDNTDVETHERVHASGFDAAQGRNLLELLGNSFHQEGRGLLKRFDQDTLRYLNQPHEAYGNFTEFREKIGLKPGEKIDVEELKRRVKKTGASMENFYRAFSDKNIVNALNTIAYQDSGEINNEYKLA